MPRSRFFLLLGLLGACAQAPEEAARSPESAPVAIGALPATYANTPACDGCLALTLTLRADGSFLVRERVGASEFYDFGRWRLAGAMLELAGGRDTRKYALKTLARAERLEVLRGPFRLVGLYDGERFMDCLTGLAWALAPSRSAEMLKQGARGQAPGFQLVAIDARFEGVPEALLVQRPATLLNERSCPAQRPG